VKFRRLKLLFPFLNWFQVYNLDYLRMDLVGGLTVALVLVPQSMAYAQLAGLPAYYGLYAAFLPPIVAALFGSSRQLATGPVAVVSLMTATALEPLATAGGEQYIAYAILLALFVGAFQFLLGVLRLGLVVNFLSHPVIGGFTNAAALIIATSQLSKLFGVEVDSGEHHYETVFAIFKTILDYVHWPTLGLAILAFLIMIVLRRVNPRIPNVLIAVAITTFISWTIHFERNRKVEISQILDEQAVESIVQYNNANDLLSSKSEERVRLRSAYEEEVNHSEGLTAGIIKLRDELELVSLEIEHLKKDIQYIRAQLRTRTFCMMEDSDERGVFKATGSHSEKTSGCQGTWRLKVGNQPLKTEALVMMGGGAVVGNIPSGLPAIAVPVFSISSIYSLFPWAMIISLLGFMEAISIAKAIAAKTGQRLDPNQELIGQGLANIVGAAGRSYAVSGSFSRSAVNLQAGAVTGLSNVISSLVVVVVLLFLTPLLYHLPQSVLAAIIMMAVVGLINFKTFAHAWQAQKYDGVISVITFIGTLTFAPHLDHGIIIGVGLSLFLYLFRNMKPAIAMLALHPDGTYRNRARFGLDQCRHVAVIRYAGSLFFANVSYLEDQMLEATRNVPELRHILIVGNGINELDTSGVDILETLVERLHSRGIRFSMSGLNDAVLDTMRRTGLLARIGEENVFRNVTRAINSIWASAHEGSNEKDCPLVSMPITKLPVYETTLSRLGKKTPTDRGTDGKTET
jgi:SulP family sulfate permease